MEQTVLPRSDGTPASAAARRRIGRAIGPAQPPKSSGHYTGNLAAFGHRRGGTGAPTATAEADARLRCLRRRSGDDDEPGTSRRESRSTAGSSGTSASDRHSARDDPTGGRSASTVSASHNEIALAILAAMTVFEVIGGVWTSDTPPEPTRDVSVSTRALDAVMPVRPEEPQIASLPTTTAHVAGIDPLTEELAASRQVAGDRAEEVRRLRSENAALQEDNAVLQRDVEALTAETTDLNEESLRLELTIAELDARLQENVDTRVVYNFVNVPVGGTVGSYGPAADAPEVVDAPEAIDTPVDFVESFSNEIASEPEEPYEPDGGGSDGDEPVSFYDHYSGREVLIRDLVDPQSVTEQLSYDPATGYHLNSQYMESDDEAHGLEMTEREIPPVRYLTDQSG